MESENNEDRIETEDYNKKFNAALLDYAEVVEELEKSDFEKKALQKEKDKLQLRVAGMCFELEAYKMDIKSLKEENSTLKSLLEKEKQKNLPSTSSGITAEQDDSPASSNGEESEDEDVLEPVTNEYLQEEEKKLHKSLEENKVDVNSRSWKIIFSFIWNDRRYGNHNEITHAVVDEAKATYKIQGLAISWRLMSKTFVAQKPKAKKRTVEKAIKEAREDILKVKRAHNKRIAEEKLQKQYESLESPAAKEMFQKVQCMR